MRKASVVAFTLAAAAALSGVSKAEAQVFRRGPFGGPRVFTGPGGPVTLTPGYGYDPASNFALGVPGVSSPMYVAPYSYYAVPPGAPARTYVPYTGSGFPFYGKPYGHPYDRWTWPYMSSSYNGLLYRYYSPPLG